MYPLISHLLLLLLQQSGSDLTSPDYGRIKERPPKCPSSNQSSQYCSIPLTKKGLNGADSTANACATPPQSRRRFFNPKNLKSPFGYRRSNTATENTTLSGEQSENKKN
jgi:hypothetical protein